MRCFFVWMQLLEEIDGIVDHVRLLRELILRGLNLLDREEIALGEVSEEREDEVPVAVGDNRFREVVFGHFGYESEDDGQEGELDEREIVLAVDHRQKMRAKSGDARTWLAR